MNAFCLCFSFLGGSDDTWADSEEFPEDSEVRYCFQHKHNTHLILVCKVLKKVCEKQTKSSSHDDVVMLTAGITAPSAVQSLFH